MFDDSGPLHRRAGCVSANEFSSMLMMIDDCNLLFVVLCSSTGLAPITLINRLADWERALQNRCLIVIYDFHLFESLWMAHSFCLFFPFKVHSSFSANDFVCLN